MYPTFPLRGRKLVHSITLALVSVLRYCFPPFPLISNNKIMHSLPSMIFFMFSQPRLFKSTLKHFWYISKFYNEINVLQTSTKCKGNLRNVECCGCGEMSYFSKNHYVCNFTCKKLQWFEFRNKISKCRPKN
jgi:hypothetical protein